MAKTMLTGVRVAYFGLAAVTTAANFIPIPVYVHMIIDTLLIIYIGSQNSVIYSGLMGEAPDGVALERMETQDAYMFPVIGSCVLFGLYCAFKFLPKEYVNIAVKVYFFVIGLFVLGQKLASILAENLPEGSADCLTKKTWQFHIPYSSYLTGAVVPVEEAEQEMTEAVASDDKGEKDAASTGAPEPVGDDDIEICAIDVVGLALAGVIAYWYLTTGHWASSNIFGMAFSIQGIEMLSIGSYFNGFVLLIGLFFYDIFWVFGTEVMVTVAKSFDAPIKLLFPQPDGTRPSMLGLGDIVIPGIFIALLLRFDYAQHFKRQAAIAATKKSSDADANAVTPSAPKTTEYFWISMFWYFLGLTTTIVVMYTFQAAQPALLYLVPAALISSLGTAFMKGEIGDLWNYEETDEEEVDSETATKEQKSE